MKYHFKIHKEGSGYWAECLEIPMCKTQAESRQELTQNMQEALNLILDEPPESEVIYPLPKRRADGRNIEIIRVEPRIAFSFYLKYLRRSKGLTQRQVAEKMGMKHLFSYQRLENPKTANPELATIVQIKRVFPEFSLDALLAA